MEGGKLIHFFLQSVQYNVINLQLLKAQSGVLVWGKTHRDTLHSCRPSDWFLSGGFSYCPAVVFSQKNTCWYLTCRKKWINEKNLHLAQGQVHQSAVPLCPNCCCSSPEKFIPKNITTQPFSLLVFSGASTAARKENSSAAQSRKRGRGSGILEHVNKVNFRAAGRSTLNIKCSVHFTGAEANHRVDNFHMKQHLWFLEKVSVYLFFMTWAVKSSTVMWQCDAKTFQRHLWLIF